MGAGHSCQQLEPKRCLGDSANARFRVAKRARSGTGQDPNWCRDPVPPGLCAERSSPRGNTPASVDRRRLDLPSEGTTRTACHADLAASSLDTLTMRPADERRSSGSIACVTASVPKKFVSKMRRTASMLTDDGGPSRASLLPALLTSTSSRPNSAPMRSAAASSVAGRFRSTSMKRAASPCECSAAAAASPSVVSRAPGSTSRPARAARALVRARCPCWHQ